jgi:hypothetical protein
VAEEKGAEEKERIIILTREAETNQNEKSCFEWKKDRYCQTIHCGSAQCHIHIFPLDRRLKNPTTT